MSESFRTYLDLVHQFQEVALLVAVALVGGFLLGLLLLALEAWVTTPRKKREESRFSREGDISLADTQKDLRAPSERGIWVV